MRAAGGIARLWAATGQRHLELQEIDYADILRERAGGQQSHWNDIIRACLNLDSPLDDETLRRLMEVCGDPERFSEFVIALEESGETNMGSKASALLRMLRGVIDLVSRTEPTKLEPLLKNMAQGFGSVSPELLLELLSTEEGRADKAADLVLQVASRMTDSSLGAFVAKGVIAAGWRHNTPGTGVPGPRARQRAAARLLEIAHAEVAESPLGQSEGFRDLWKNAADMLTSYSDEQFVSEAYARELSGARTQALEVERVSDDPPDRIGSWVTSVGAAEVRALDLRLLARPADDRAGPGAMESRDDPGVSHIEDLLLVGDFEGALQLTAILTNEADGDGDRKPAAMAAVARLAEGIDDDARGHAPAGGRGCGRRATEAAVRAWSDRPSSKGSPKRSPSRNGRQRASVSRRFCRLRRRAGRTRSSSCAHRRIRQSGERRFTCCANSAAPKRCRT